MSIPVIDLFAGPGGLNEGFSSEIDGQHFFKTVLSIEKAQDAHETLSLRAFYRYFIHNKLPIPADYYSYLAKKIDRKDLFAKYPEASETAAKEAILATLGERWNPNCFFDEKIRTALNNNLDWLLIGGPPCQAYSLAGRSRRLGALKNTKGEMVDEAKTFFSDEKHTLYKEYLRIIAVHAPAIFVMENVKGILSSRSKLNGKKIFPKILKDLKKPYLAANEYDWNNAQQNDYHIVSFVTGNKPSKYEDYLIKAERYGIPQSRHRVILLGIRDDYWKKIAEQVIPLSMAEKQITVRDVFENIPPLRSGFSKREDSETNWKESLSQAERQPWFAELSDSVKAQIIAANHTRQSLKLLRNNFSTAYIPTQALGGWFADCNLQFLPNHETRGHMASDLYRYLFVSAYGSAKEKSPQLNNFPELLLPKHKNVISQKDNKKKEQKFSDRFKVQKWSTPSSTITSHISKDGHYFIHPDPVQCRSLTVREAARLQTFPDNYFFEGNRTQQYHQVGNAVPPYLAKLLAQVVYDIYQRALNLEPVLC